MDVQERMAKTVKGQVTWANPDLGKKCSGCAHIQKVPRAELPKNPLIGVDHRCGLVKVHTGKKGEAFNARTAIACNKFKGVLEEAS